ncbi:MAG: LysR family transcriptional regulator [Paracoccaceae bacterium]
MDVQWDDMRIFLAVARLESLSSAGRILKLDPATVGRRVGRLEDSLGVLLFLKSPQGYALSDVGQRFLAHAERAEQSILLAKEDLGGQAGQLTGLIRIGAPDGCANYLLPQICAKIGAENPGLDLQIVALPRVFNLSKREADMAVALSQPETGRLSVQKIADFRLHLAASADYLSQNATITTSDDLKSHRIVGYIPEMIFDKELDYLAETGAEHVHIASNSVSVQINLLRQGAGVGIIHDFAMPFCPELELVLPGQIKLTRSFYLIRHVDDRKVERLNRIAELIWRGIKKEVARLEALLDS